jgi:hypothetical protein
VFLPPGSSLILISPCRSTAAHPLHGTRNQGIKENRKEKKKRREKRRKSEKRGKEAK